MLIKFICCDVFTRIACDLVAKSRNIIDLEFIPMLTHVEPDKLRQLIQERIDNNVSESGRKYEALILGFGLCGNAATGLSCPIPMVIPRAHDCCTILMGSRESFTADFGNSLSTRWCSTGYYERTSIRGSGYPNLDQLANYKTSAEYMRYLEQYDEDTAEYLWRTMHPMIETDESIYIKTEGFEYSDSYENYKAQMDKMDIHLRTVTGDVSLLRALTEGDWDEEKFLLVPPGKKIVGVYDMEYVMRAGE